MGECGLLEVMKKWVVGIGLLAVMVGVVPGGVRGEEARAEATSIVVAGDGEVNVRNEGSVTARGETVQKRVEIRERVKEMRQDLREEFAQNLQEIKDARRRRL